LLRRFAPRNDGVIWTDWRTGDETTLRLHHGKQASWNTLHGRYILPKRAFEHREGLVEGFTAKYGCKILVWYELHETMIEAITREKQIKAGSRAKKLALIEALNPEWKDLCESLI
jgi:putative endonuclease